MPQNNQGYLICNHLPSQSKHGFKMSYQWEEGSPEKLNKAVEIAPQLFEIYKNYAQNPIEDRELARKVRGEMFKILPRNFFSANTTCKFSKKHVPEDLFVNNIEKHLAYFAYFFRDILNWSFPIAIDFSEVFYVPEGASLPSHYRQNIDICVNSLEEYKKATSSFSYQLFKTIISSLTPKINIKKNTPLDKIIINEISSKPKVSPLKAFFNFNIPVSNLAFFNSSIEAIINYEIAEKNYLKYDKIDLEKSYIILPFSFVVNSSDIEEIISHFSINYPFKEQIIILQGSHYEKDFVRQEVYHSILNIIHKLNCQSFIHVLLLPTKEVNYSLLELAPRLLASNEPFSPLAENRGYYLSAKDLFMTINHNIYKAEVGHLSFKWWSNLLEKNTTEQPVYSRKIKDDNGFIFKEEIGDNFRFSKLCSKKELKAQFEVHYNQQNQLQQMQVVNQNQEVAKQQKISQQRQHNHQISFNRHAFIPPYPYAAFAINLILYVEHKRKKWSETDLLLEDIYYTEFYRKNYSERAWLDRFITKKKFRIEVLAQIFSAFHSKSPFTKFNNKPSLDLSHDAIQMISHEMQKNPLIQLGDSYNFPYEVNFIPNFSATCVELNLVHPIFSNLEDFSDGINPESQFFDYSYIFRNNSLVGWQNLSTVRPSKSYSVKELGIKVSYLALFANKNGQGYQSHLNAGILFSPYDLENYENPQLMLNYAESLLEIFSPNSNADALEKEVIFLEFLRIYLPHTEEILKKLFSVFSEHNLDNLRILLQLLISGRQASFEVLAEFLNYLDERSLLNSFYKIYFQYGKTAFSLVNFFIDEKDNSVDTAHNHNGKNFTNITTTISGSQEDYFLIFVNRIPCSSTTNEWPLFEKFCNSLLIFAAKYQMRILTNDLQEIENFFHRFSAKLLQYFDNDSEQRDLFLNRFVSHIVSDDGLCFAKLRKLDTLLTGLEDLLDHAMKKRTLVEQISELNGLSFAWMDVPYAIKNNNFQIVSKDMAITAGKVGFKRSSYEVTLNELKKIIQEYQSGDSFLITAVFRYLSKETFREQLSFYRELTKSQSNSYLHQLIFAHYVLISTGVNYNPRLNEKIFINSCIDFLSAHPLAKTMQAEFPIVICNFYEKIKSIKTAEEQGSLCLWTLWQDQQIYPFRKTTSLLPTILGQKFERRNIGNFLLKFQEELINILPNLTEDPELVFSLIQNCFTKEEISQRKHQYSLSLLSIIYPELCINIFMHNLLEILLFIETQKLISDPDSEVYLGLRAILNQYPDIELSIVLTKLGANFLQINPELRTFYLAFLQDLASQPFLLANIKPLSPVLEPILSYYATTKIANPSLVLLFGFFESLNIETDVLVFSTILQAMHRRTGYSFFEKWEGLNSSQLKNIANFLEHFDYSNLAFSLLELALMENRNYDFTGLLEAFRNTLPYSKKQMVFLFVWLTKAGYPLQQSIQAIKAISPHYYFSLTGLCRQYKIAANELWEILASPNVQEAIDNFERRQEEGYLDYYQYDVKDIANKIARITFKTWEDGPDEYLAPTTQKRLLKEYQQVMACMIESPILIEENGEPFTVHQLLSRQYVAVFQELKRRISKGENQKQNQLLLIALCCKALLKTHGKFPRSTQLISLIHSLSDKNHKIQELKTGEGKSITAAIHAVLMVAEGKTANIVTENEELAREGLRKFGDFFDCLGIPFANTVIEAHSLEFSYVPNGINYSTAYGLALFFIRMELNRIKLPNNLALIWDEIDANLTSATVKFSLAMPLDPIYMDTQKWELIYEYLLEFVGEKELFIDNKCDKEIDVKNFKHYCLLKNTDKFFARFITQIEEDFLSKLIDSAKLAGLFEANIDYMIVTKDHPKTSYYPAPILGDLNHRPEPRASYDKGLQPLIATKEKKNLPEGSIISFEIEAISETVVTLSPKNFFDFFRSLGGRCIGLTGTGGSKLLRREFYELYGLVVYNYPSFYEDLCEDYGVFPAEGFEEQKEISLALIRDKKNSSPTQNILIMTETPHAAAELEAYLRKAEPAWLIQRYDGYDRPGFPEKKFIKDAAKPGQISIATPCDGRGADFFTRDQVGFFEINLCTDLTEETLRQFMGRCDRNGKPGEFCSVIDVLKLGLTRNHSLYEIEQAFKDHQNDISFNAQKSRKKNRLLDDTRNLIIRDYLIKLRREADELLAPQLGRHNSFIPEFDFMKILHDFTKKSEIFYQELLGDSPYLNEREKESFFHYLTEEYNQVLHQWLPDGKFDSFVVIEPEIPVQKLIAVKGINKLKLAQLTILSELLSLAWQEIGHQALVQYLPELQKIVDIFSSLLIEAANNAQDKSIKTIVAEFIFSHDYIKIEEVTQNLDAFSNSFSIFMDEFPKIPGIDPFIPKEKIRHFVNDYLAQTKEQFIERKWEEISLPYFDPEKIRSWGRKLPLGKNNRLGKLGIKLIIKVSIMPKIMDFAKKQLEELFPDDKQKQLILLKCLKELRSPIIKLLSEIPFSITSPKGIVSLFFDYFLPILEHKSTEKAALVWGKEEAALLQGAIQLSHTLKPYRDIEPRDFLNLQTLLPLFQYACQLNLVQPFIKNPIFKELLSRVSEFDAEFFIRFAHIDLLAIADLSIVLAHPHFYEFLTALPKEATFAHLKAWLTMDENEVHPTIRAPLQRLRERMLNKEITAEQNHLKLMALKGKFLLTTEKIQEGLAALISVVYPRQLEAEEEEIVHQPVPAAPVPAQAPAPEPAPEINIAEETNSKMSNGTIALIILAVLVAIPLAILFCWILIPIALIAAVIYLVKGCCQAEEEPFPVQITENKVINQEEALSPNALERESKNEPFPYLQPIVIQPKELEDLSQLLPPIEEEEEEDVPISILTFAKPLQEIIPSGLLDAETIYTSQAANFPTFFKNALSGSSRRNVNDPEDTLKSALH